MDVRCDRCETEYELDDDSVTEGGASVQCTTCGHTFVVGRNGVTIAQIVPTPPGGMSDLAGPQSADWCLATEDGQTHRFRDLTTLQKWVVERKATREDQLSQRGGPWRPLGDVSELAPFFDVVEEADRARSSGSGGAARRSGTRPGPGPTPRPTPTRQNAVSRGGASRSRPTSVDFDTDGDTGSLSSRIDADSTMSPTLDSYTLPPEEDQFETMAIFRNQRRLKIAGAAGFAALVIVAAFIGFRRPNWFKSSEPARVVEAPSGSAATPAAVARTQLSAPGSAAAPPAAAGHAAPVIAPIPPGPPTIPSTPPAGAGVATPPVDRGAADVAGGGVKGKSYERLVADADRLMENGSPVRAQKLLDQALLLQPNGVAALSGIAYLQLDRQRPLAAISTFKRALGYSPEFPPALFGLAEAYRAQGELSQAAENYRKYISVAPGGPDAPAARRQLKDIDSAAPRRAPAAESPPASYNDPGSAPGQTP